MIRLLILYGMLSFSLAGQPVEDPYGVFTYMHEEYDEKQIDIDKNVIGCTSTTGEWMDVYYYSGSDSIQSIIVSNDIYERKVGIQCLREGRTYFNSLEPLLEKNSIAIVRNMAIYLDEINIYYRQFPISESIESLLMAGLTDKQFADYLYKIK